MSLVKTGFRFFLIRTDTLVATYDSFPKSGSACVSRNPVESRFRILDGPCALSGTCLCSQYYVIEHLFEWLFDTPKWSITYIWGANQGFGELPARPFGHLRPGKAPDLRFARPNSGHENQLPRTWHRQRQGLAPCDPRSQ